MSEFYTPKRIKNLYTNAAIKPFKLSRSKIENFMNCPRCFYFDRKLGVSPPPGYPFTLNSAVDTLLKREFDSYRHLKKPHPIMKSHGIKAVPYLHDDLETWRDALRGGMAFHHLETNLLITGGVDDVWIDKDGWLNIVDYKATSKVGEVNLDSDWQIGYKRQMEIYQWLFRQNGHKVSDTGYFVYCNGDSTAERFDNKLSFNAKVIPYSGNDSWVEEALFSIKQTLEAKSIPEPNSVCSNCAYIFAISDVVNSSKKQNEV